jgi:uroporphyrin-III C-methyltransferase/precorrin-2 dehydrogenase/sirohydrochlorin ferrochelatase
MDINNRQCLVVGGGKVAARKVHLLNRAGAKVTVISPELTSDLSSMVQNNEIESITEQYSGASMSDYAVVIAATDSADANKQVSEDAKKQGVPVNVVDQPELCTFIMPSIIDRSPVQIAVSTGGASPVLARLLRSKLETVIPSAYGRLAELIELYRNKVKEKFSSIDDRKKFWEDVLEGPIAESLIAGKDKDAKQALEKAVSEAKAPDPQGEVYLVGAGPGDPDLLTFRSIRLMQQAEEFVYDRLVSKEILDLVRRDADFVYAGKERDNHAIPQENINQLLVRLAKEGKRVLRLKGGDPFIFGRGGEEIETLMEENVNFQVVPGITAAAGCAAYAGIPLTHRDYVQSCTFVTGHLKDGSIDLNWKALAHANQTIVFYMGLHGVAELCKQLTLHGLDKNTPAALVEKGTTQHQKVHIGNLTTLADIVKENNVKAPTLIIVGEVVSLHDKLSWFHPNG